MKLNKLHTLDHFVDIVDTLYTKDDHEREYGNYDTPEGIDAYQAKLFRYIENYNYYLDTEPTVEVLHELLDGTDNDFLPFMVKGACYFAGEPCATLYDIAEATDGNLNINEIEL